MTPQRKPNPVPSVSDRFAEAIANVERAMLGGDDTKTREAIREAGLVAWNLAPQINGALGDLEKRTATRSPMPAPRQSTQTLEAET
jgi:hypothetical protein